MDRIRSAGSRIWGAYADSRPDQRAGLARLEPAKQARALGPDARSVLRPLVHSDPCGCRWVGVCLDSMLLAEQELRSGQLVAVLPETAMRARGHGLLALRSKAGTGKLSAFED